MTPSQNDRAVNNPPEAPPTLPERDYLRFLSEGRFMLQRSASSGRFVFYPRVAEPGTGATDL